MHEQQQQQQSKSIKIYRLWDVKCIVIIFVDRKWSFKQIKTLEQTWRWMSIVNSIMWLRHLMLDYFLRNTSIILLLRANRSVRSAPYLDYLIIMIQYEAGSFFDYFSSRSCSCSHIQLKNLHKEDFLRSFFFAFQWIFFFFVLSTILVCAFFGFILLQLTSKQRTS